MSGVTPAPGPIPEFIIPKREFPDERDFERVFNVGQFCVTNSMVAANTLRSFTQVSEITDVEVLKGIIGRPPWSEDKETANRFLASSSAMFTRGHDRHIEFDNGTNGAIEDAVKTIERKSGGTVYDDEKRMLRLQMFLKRCFEWSMTHTPESPLIIPGQRTEMAPGGRLVPLL